MRISLFVIVAIALLIQPSFAWADTATAEPGVTTAFESLLANSSAKPAIPDTRVSRLFSLYVARGVAPTPFTPAGPFRAIFEGDLTLRLREFLSFSAQGRGKLSLSINGKPVLNLAGDSFPSQPTEPLRLNKGKNHFVAVYESPESGDSEFRILWSSRTFRPEPIPPGALSHDPASAHVRESEQIREGRFLLGEFRCTKCHATKAAGDIGAMPELTQDAPSFENIGARLRPAWMAAWINNPRSLRRDAHMPRLFHGAHEHGIDQRAADLAAFLASMGPQITEDATKPDPAKIATGGRLFSQLDCIACHTLPDAETSGSRRFRRIARFAEICEGEVSGWRSSAISPRSCRTLRMEPHAEFLSFV